MNDNNDIIIRKATRADDLIRISELIYGVDPYIYPYWFNSLEECKKILPKLLLQDKFIFNIDTFYLAIDQIKERIIGVASLIDSYFGLDYDYTELLNYNDRFNYTIKNYIYPMIDNIKLKNAACLTNMCVDKDYRNRHVGLKLLGIAINDYINSKNNISDSIEFDVLADNVSAIHLYKHLGFIQVGGVEKGFNGPGLEPPNVIYMKKQCKQ